MQILPKSMGITEGRVRRVKMSSLFPILAIEAAFLCFPHEGEKTSHFICSVICCTTFMIGAESGAKWPPFSVLTDLTK